MCLSSGNYEFIGIRHRRDQTLYISPLIDRVSIGNYGWLQTGLYLAVIEDALARFSSSDESNGSDLDPADSGDSGSMRFDQAGGHSSGGGDEEGHSGGGGNEGGTGYQPEDSGGSTSVHMFTLVSFFA